MSESASVGARYTDNNESEDTDSCEEEVDNERLANEEMEVKIEVEEKKVQINLNDTLGNNNEDFTKYETLGKQIAYLTPANCEASNTLNSPPATSSTCSARNLSNIFEENDTGVSTSDSNTGIAPIEQELNFDDNNYSPLLSSESEYLPSTESSDNSESEDMEDTKQDKLDHQKFQEEEIEMAEITSLISGENKEPENIQYSEDNKELREITDSEEIKDPKEIKYSKEIKESDENKEFQDNMEVENNEELESSSDLNKHAIMINPSRKKLDGRRIRDKKHICYFCNKIILHVARHFECAHSMETDVARILAMPKKSARRREAFSSIIKAGDFYHNCDVLATKNGELLLVRRPSKNAAKLLNYSDFGPCPECLGFMAKKHLWHHLKYNCTKRQCEEGDVSLKEKRFPIAESNAIMNEVLGAEFSSDFIRNIVSKFKDDKVGQFCKEDKLILKFGALQYEKYSTTQCELIRQSMRQLARFTIEIQKIDTEINSLSDCFVPHKFDAVIQAVKNLCVTHVQITNRPEYPIPSLALKLGHAFRKCIAIERGGSIKRGDLKRNETLILYLTLLDLEWSARISSNALSTRKLNCKQLLPLTSDLIKLSAYLDTNISSMMQELIKYENNITQSWNQLSSLVLTRIILFNKQRSGAAARMTLENYSSRPNWSNQCSEELKNSLTPLENELASRLTLIEIEGKGGRKVPVLLTLEIKQAIELLIKTRSNALIDTNNPYIFANSLLGYISGHDCVGKFCHEAGLESLDLITGTKLCKYIATVCQVFSLSENESDWLVKHLGHGVRVPREFYRLLENTVELTKISRLLLVVDEGEVSKHSGKRLSDIHIKDLPAIAEDDDPSDSEDYKGNLENMDTEKNKDIVKAIMNENNSTDTETTYIKKMKLGTQKQQMRTYIKKVWTTEESSAVLKSFKTHVKLQNLPGKRECEKCISANKCLETRKWTDIKFYIKNHITRINKQNLKRSHF